MADEEVERIRRIIEQYKRNKLREEEKAALYGMNVPLEIRNSIEYAEEQIGKYETQLRALTGSPEGSSGITERHAYRDRVQNKSSDQSINPSQEMVRVLLMVIALIITLGSIVYFVSSNSVRDGSNSLTEIESTRVDPRPSTLAPAETSPVMPQRRVAFVSEDNDGMSKIVLLDVDSRQIKKILADNNIKYYFPDWSPNGEYIVSSQYFGVGAAPPSRTTSAKTEYNAAQLGT